MRLNTPILATLFILLTCNPACNGGGGDVDAPDPAEVCPTVCQKEDDCDVLGTATYEECLAECLDFGDNMLDGYLEALAICTEEKTCAELTGGVTSQGACYQENVDLCTTNTDDYVEAACLVELACDGNDDPTTQELDTCMERMHGDGNILICFEPAVIAELKTCVESANGCHPNPIPTCVQDIVGLELGSSGN